MIEPLLDSDDPAGAFGKVAGKKVKRLPSSVYWSGLGVWGIRLTPFSQEEYHKRINETYRHRDELKTLEKNAKTRGDDVDVDKRNISLTWHSGLPAPPDDFPQKADFRLTGEEAQFIRDRIQVRCPDSLLAFLTLNCKPANVDTPWEHPDFGNFSTEHKELLNHARLFSETMHGAALLYNLQLAGLRKHDDLISEHRSSFDEWTKYLPLKEIRSWSLKRLWESQLKTQ